MRNIIKIPKGIEFDIVLKTHALSGYEVTYTGPITLVKKESVTNSNLFGGNSEQIYSLRSIGEGLGSIVCKRPFNESIAWSIDVVVG